MGPDGLWDDKANPPGGYGSAADPAAWFNVLPPYMATKGLSFYYNNGSPKNYLTGFPDNTVRKQNSFPFPGRAGSPIWFCPSGQMSDSDANSLGPPGAAASVGFFAYAMPIDLNKKIGTATATTEGTSYTYPQMPPITTLPKPAATVMMFDQLFNPNTEAYTQNPSDSEWNDTNPANRFKEPLRGIIKVGWITFCDGHTSYYKINYVTNDCDFSTSVECYGPGKPAVPDIIWDPAFRAALGY